MSSLSPDLKIGITLDNFRLSGNIPLIKDLFMMIERGRSMIWEIDFRICIGIIEVLLVVYF